jgi:hypothetical protein
MAREMMDLAMKVTGEIGITDGDFEIVESTAEHQKELLLNQPDEFLQNPGVCVGAWSFMDDENVNGLIREMSLKFARDGMQVNSIRADASGIIRSDAYYV